MVIFRSQMPQLILFEVFYRQYHDYNGNLRFCPTCTENVELDPFCGSQPILVKRDVVGELEDLEKYFSNCHLCGKELWELHPVIDDDDD